ncbi:MAG: DUF2283 domain-containing protein [Abditibacteriales bacterium]|nr:DUF2283 domain-containing protein [Abditibacteriales bacterium]MDW8368035.1 DUF2283 domain-containing protein [Abditibacteriales bacterium]
MAEKISMGYDREGNILEIFFGDPAPSIADEVEEGIFVGRFPDDNRVVNIMILTFTKRFKGLELLDVPLELSVAAG